MPKPLLPLLLTLLLPGAAHADIRLDGTGGDSWAFRREVSGTADVDCQQVEVHAGGRRVPARREGDRFVAVVPLAAGDNAVVAVCRTTGGEERSAPQSWKVRLREAPTARIELAVEGGVVRLDGASSTRSEGDDAAIVAWRWSARPANPAPLALLGHGPRMEAAAPTIDGEYLVALEVTDASGRQDRAEAAFVVRDGRAAAAPDTPPWLERAVVYGVVPSLFGPRGLEDVRPRLDALRALGVDTLRISPVADAPANDAVTDPFAVGPVYGRREALRGLVDDAHARGLRVILDFVPDRTADRHPYFQHADEHGAASPYFSWYERAPDGGRAFSVDREHRPHLDYDHPEVRRFLRGALADWVRTLDVDGFRVDVGWGAQRRASDFWTSVRRDLKRIKPDVALVAEASARDRELLRAGFDAAYDWTDEPGRWAWAEAFSGPRPDLTKLREALQASAGRTLRFFDNDDTGARFMTRHGRGLQAVAAALVFTLPGIPSLSTGVEADAEYEPDRREAPLDLSRRAPIADTLADLAALRRREPALLRGGLRLLGTSSSDTVLAFLRGDAGRPVVVASNFGPEQVRAEVAVPFDGPLQDLIGRGVTRARNGMLVVDLPGYGTRVLAPPR